MEPRISSVHLRFSHPCVLGKGMADSDKEQTDWGPAGSRWAGHISGGPVPGGASRCAPAVTVHSEQRSCLCPTDNLRHLLSAALSSVLEGRLTNSFEPPNNLNENYKMFESLFWNTRVFDFQLPFSTRTVPLLTCIKYVTFPVLLVL